MMDIQWSKTYLTNRTDWIIDESTFQVLDEDSLLWVARVTTTHHKRRYEESKKRSEGLPPGVSIDLGSPDEKSFYILVRSTEHFILEDKNLPILADWLKKQVIP